MPGSRSARGRLYQHAQGNGGDTVVDAVRGRAGMDHQPGPEGVAEPVPQSRQRPDVGTARGHSQLGLEGQDAAVGEVGD